MEKTRAAWITALVSFAFTFITNADRIAKFFGVINIPKDAQELLVALSQVPTLVSWAILVIGLAALAYLHSEQFSTIAAPVLRFFREWEFRIPVVRKSSPKAKEPPHPQSLTRELAQLLAATTPPNAAQPPSLSQGQKDRKLRALDKLRDQVRRMQPLINRAEQLKSGAWNAFAAGNGFEYARQVLDFRDEFDNETRALDALRDQYPEYEDAIEETRMPQRERWVRAIGDHMVTSQMLFTYLEPNTPNNVFVHLASENAEAFSQFVISYINWHNHARVCLDHLCREMAR